MAKNNGRKSLSGISVIDETRSQIKIIEGQSMASSSDVFEQAIALLYALMPEDKNDRKPLDLVVREAVETIKGKCD